MRPALVLKLTCTMQVFWAFRPEHGVYVAEIDASFAALHWALLHVKQRRQLRDNSVMQR